MLELGYQILFYPKSFDCAQFLSSPLSPGYNQMIKLI